MTTELSQVITDIAAGPFGSNLKVECFVPTGFPIIDGANLKEFKVTDNITKFVTEEKAQSLHRSIARRGDVVVTISGTIGQIAYIPEDSEYEAYLVSQRQFRVTFDNTQVFVPYLVYYFHTVQGQHQILSFANQTGVPALSQPLKNFKKITIDLPSLDEQRRIAGILGSLDDKIELNRRINANLEEQAQALFNNISRTSPTQKGILKDLIEIKYGKDHKNLKDGNIPVYGSGGIMRYVDTPIYENETVLIPRKGSLNNIIYLNTPFWSVDTMFYSVMKYDHIAKYVYFFLKSKNLSAMNAGSAVPSMTTDILYQMKIDIPDKKVFEVYDAIVSPLFLQIQNNQIESNCLSTLRDILLPKLMKGEIKVN